MVLYALLTSTPFYLAGWVAILSFLASLAQRVWALYQAKQDTRSLAERYGRDSYVLITGASDGVGKALAYSFAARGLNLILVARNPTKLSTVKAEILRAHPSTKIEIFTCDFSKSFDAGFYANLFAFTSQFDVSIVVNNVGMATNDYLATYDYNTKTADDLLEIMTVNTVAQSCLHLLYLKKLKLRASRSAFLDVSSVASLASALGSQFYSATKLFNAYLNKSLAAAQGGSNIDYLVYYLGGTRTAMMDWATRATGSELPLTISPSDAAEAIIPFLGKSLTSYGHWKHFAMGEMIKVSSWIDDCTPYSMAFRGALEFYHQNNNRRN